MCCVTTLSNRIETNPCSNWGKRWYVIGQEKWDGKRTRVGKKKWGRSKLQQEYVLITLFIVYLHELQFYTYTRVLLLVGNRFYGYFKQFQFPILICQANLLMARQKLCLFRNINSLPWADDLFESLSHLISGNVSCWIHVNFPKFDEWRTGVISKTKSRTAFL